jgi:uncharacterized membrane protein
MTTGEVLILLLTAIPLFILWAAALSEVVWRRRMPLPRRIGWLVALLVLPVVALAAYVLVRPSRTESLVALRWSSHPSTRATVGTERAAALVLAAEQHARGELDDERYGEVVAVAVGPVGSAAR